MLLLSSRRPGMVHALASLLRVRGGAGGVEADHERHMSASVCSGASLPAPLSPARRPRQHLFGRQPLASLWSSATVSHKPSIQTCKIRLHPSADMCSTQPSSTANSGIPPQLQSRSRALQGASCAAQRSSFRDWIGPSGFIAGQARGRGSVMVPATMVAAPARWHSTAPGDDGSGKSSPPGSSAALSRGRCRSHGRAFRVEGL